MAKDNSRLYAPGVSVTECWHSDEYCGSAGALVSAGLVRLDQLPGQPGMNKCCVTFYDGERLVRKQSNRDEKYLNIKTAGKKFTVVKGVSKEVKAERRAAIDAEYAAKRDAERDTATSKFIAEGTLQLLPKTPGEYRQKLVEGWDMHARIFRANALPKDGNGTDVYSMAASGFRLEDSDIEKFDELASEIRTLLMNAGVRFNAKRQSEIVSNCNAAIAKGDSKFQSMLASCIE